MAKSLERIEKDLKKSVHELDKFCADANDQIAANTGFIGHAQWENKVLLKEKEKARQIANSISWLTDGDN